MATAPANPKASDRAVTEARLAANFDAGWGGGMATASRWCDEVSNGSSL